MATTQDRYENRVEIKTLRNGKKVYRSLRPKSISPDSTNIQITATDTLRMDSLSYTLYGTPMEWWKIASINGRVDGSLYFRPGSQILIPQS